MPPLDFPDAPATSPVYVANGRSWFWDGAKWRPTYTSGSTGTAVSYVINVKDPPYGAKGDGVTNDAPAFTAALAAAANGGEIVVPSGTYNIASALSQTITGNVAFRGAGSGVTILSFSGATDGLTFTLATNVAVHVSGLTIIRQPGSGVTYANTGLTLTSPGSTSLRYGISDLYDIAFIGGAYFWATGIHVHDISSVGFDHISYVAPNATGTGGGVGVGILIEGQSASSYMSEARLNDITTQGGSVGLQIGDWVQGVYLTQSALIGNDYGVRWSGVAANADLWLAITNTHCNSGTRGIFSDQGMSPQIVNTYHLHFGIPSLDGSYSAIELQIVGPALICNNSFYGSGSASTSTSEVAIDVEGGNNTIIYGNFISNMKNAGIYFNGTLNTIVTGNVAGLPAGIPLVQYAGGSVSPTNKSFGNMLNDALTFSGPWINAANDAAAATAGVPIDGVYLNGSAMMVRKA